MDAEIRDGFRYRGGHIALDFTASLTKRLKPEPVDLLDGPEALGRWLMAAGLVPQASMLDGLDRGALETARAVREAIYTCVLAGFEGEELPAEALNRLNRAAEEVPAVPQLDAIGHMHFAGDARAYLGLIAQEAVRLLGGPEAGRVRQCQASGCAILFRDTSRSGERRWCSMAACGNKAKVAEFRRRKREAAAAAKSGG